MSLATNIDGEPSRVVPRSTGSSATRSAYSRGHAGHVVVWIALVPLDDAEASPYLARPDEHSVRPTAEICCDGYKKPKWSRLRGACLAFACLRGRRTKPGLSAGSTCGAIIAAGNAKGAPMRRAPIHHFLHLALYDDDGLVSHMRWTQPAGSRSSSSADGPRSTFDDDQGRRHDGRRHPAGASSCRSTTAVRGVQRCVAAHSLDDVAGTGFRSAAADLDGDRDPHDQDRPHAVDLDAVQNSRQRKRCF